MEQQDLVAATQNSDVERQRSFVTAFKARLQQWAESGMFTKERIMERLTVCAQRHYSDDELDYFRTAFESRCIGSSIKYWDEAIFTAFLARLFPPSSPPFQEAAPALFRSISYCSGLPFTTSTSLRLTAETLLRAVAIHIPKKNPMSHGRQVGDWLISREWDTSDYRRLLFRSLANPTSTFLSAPSHPPITDLDPSPEGNDEDLYLDVSGEEPAMTDLLDALSAAHPRHGGRHAVVPRAFYQSIVATLPHARPSLDQMRLPREEWFAVIKLGLTMKLGLGPSPHTDRFLGHLSELNTVAACILHAFVDADEGGLSWANWERVISRSLPHLLNPLSNLFHCFFVEKVDYPTHYRAFLPNPGRLLTFSRLSQIACFLSESRLSQLTSFLLEYSEWDKLEPLYSTSPSMPWYLEDLLLAVTLRQRPSLLLISGYRLPSTASSSTSSLASSYDASYVLFGAYLPNLWVATPESHSDDEESLLFQLAPVHDVFPATINRNRYAELLEQGIMQFDDENGVRLGFDERSREGHFEYGVASKKSGGKRQDLGKEGGRQERFKIEDIEVWVFMEGNS